MKRMIIIAAVIIFVVMIAVIHVCPGGLYTCGMLRIPEAGLDVELTTSIHGSDCGCCGVLYQGGVTYTDDDMEGIQLYTMVYLAIIDYSVTVLEYVGSEPCLRFGNLLIGNHGIIKTDGDLLVVNGCVVYRFVRL